MNAKKSSISTINPENEKDLDFIIRKHLSVPKLWIDNYSFSENEVIENITHVKEKITSKTAIINIIKKDDEIISFIWFEIIENNPKTVDITSLWTSEHFRKQGYASVLKKDLEQWCKSRGINKITTTVSIRNPGIIYMNESLDYKITSYNMCKILDN